MSAIKFSLGVQELVVVSSIIYPLNAPESTTQAIVPLADGGVRVETVGQYDTKELDLIWDKITPSEVDAIRDWRNNVVNKAAVPFTYHDPDGVQWLVRDITNPFDPKRESFNYYSLQLKLRKE